MVVTWEGGDGLGAGAGAGGGQHRAQGRRPAATDGEPGAAPALAVRANVGSQRRDAQIVEQIRPIRNKKALQEESLPLPENN